MPDGLQKRPMFLFDVNPVRHIIIRD